MAQTTMVNFRIDADMKKEVEEICASMGLMMAAAYIRPFTVLCWGRMYQIVS